MDTNSTVYIGTPVLNPEKKYMMRGVVVHDSQFIYFIYLDTNDKLVTSSFPYVVFKIDSANMNVIWEYRYNVWNSCARENEKKNDPDYVKFIVNREDDKCFLYIVNNCITPKSVSENSYQSAVHIIKIDCEHGDIVDDPNLNTKKSPIIIDSSDMEKTCNMFTFANKEYVVAHIFCDKIVTNKGVLILAKTSNFAEKTSANIDLFPEGETIQKNIVLDTVCVESIFEETLQLVSCIAACTVKQGEHYLSHTISNKITDVEKITTRHEFTKLDLGGQIMFVLSMGYDANYDNEIIGGYLAALVKVTNSYHIKILRVDIPMNDNLFDETKQLPNITVTHIKNIIPRSPATNGDIIIGAENLIKNDFRMLDKKIYTTAAIDTVDGETIWDNLSPGGDGTVKIIELGNSLSRDIFQSDNDVSDMRIVLPDNEQRTALLENVTASNGELFIAYKIVVNGYYTYIMDKLCAQNEPVHITLNENYINNLFSARNVLTLVGGGAEPESESEPEPEPEPEPESESESESEPEPCQPCSCAGTESEPEQEPDPEPEPEPEPEPCQPCSCAGTSCDDYYETINIAKEFYRERAKLYKGIIRCYKCREELYEYKKRYYMRNANRKRGGCTRFREREGNNTRRRIRKHCKTITEADRYRAYLKMCKKYMRRR